jgi:hypothetical protein
MDYVVARLDLSNQRVHQRYHRANYEAWSKKSISVGNMFTRLYEDRYSVGFANAHQCAVHSVDGYEWLAPHMEQDTGIYEREHQLGKEAAAASNSRDVFLDIARFVRTNWLREYLFNFVSE